MSYLVPLLNGKAYEWVDAKINIMGVAISEIIAIDYSDKRDGKNLWGAGSYPGSRGSGNYEATAKLTLRMSEVEAIQDVAPLNGDITLIPEFDISISFIHPSLTIRKHIIKNCRFLNNGRTMKSGDQSIDCELNLLVSHIIWNGANGLT